MTNWYDEVPDAEAVSSSTNWYDEVPDAEEVSTDLATDTVAEPIAAPKEELSIPEKAADWYVEEKSKPKSSFGDYVKTLGRGAKDFFLSDKQQTYQALAADENNPDREQALQGQLDTIAERQDIREEASKTPFGGLVSGIGQSLPLLPAAVNPVSRGTTAEGFVAKTAINTAGGAEIGYRSGITDEERQTGAVGGAVGGAILPPVFGAIERGIGAGAAKLTSKKPAEEILQTTAEGLDDTQAQALAQVSLGARKPTTLNPEQTIKLQGEMPPVSAPDPAKDIKLQIDKEIADIQATKPEGYQEQIKQLQAEKAATSWKPTKDSNAELTVEQFETNIAKPVQAAIDAKVSIPRIRDELVQSLSAANRKPEEIDNIVEAALAPYLEGNPITAPIPELPPSKLAKFTDETRTPPKRGDKQVNEQELKQVLSSSGMKASLGFNNDLSPFYYISRAFSKKNGNKFGSSDNITGDKYLALIKNNRFQHDNAIIPHLVGAEDGSSKFILKSNKDGIIEDDFSIKPLMTIQKDALDSGLNSAQLDEFRLAANALDDYTNIELDVAKAADSVKELKTAILKETDPAVKFKLNQELKNKSRELKEISSQETYTRYKDREGNFVAMPKQRVEEIINGLKENPAGAKYLEDLQKWSQHLIDIRVEAGILSKAEAEALKKAHPYYLSAKREIETFGFDDLRTFTSTGSANKGLKSREISSADYTASPVENTVANMQGAVRAAQRNKERQLMLDFLIEKLDPAAWKQVFREDMQDVMYAIQRAKYDPKAPKVIEANQITKANSLEKTGNFQVFYNGKRIDLTIVGGDNGAMFKSIVRPTTYIKDTNPKIVKAGIDSLIGLAQAKRNLTTTYDAEFSIKSLIRESFGYAYTSDAKIIGRANKYKFWKSYTILNDFRKNPDFYRKLKENVSPGVLNRDYKAIKGDDLVQDVAKSKLFYNEASKGSKALKALKNNKIVSSLEDFAQLSDMATRGRYYKDVKTGLLKQGKTEAEAEVMAMSAARDLAVNYQERGANRVFNSYKAMAPFLKTTINSITKDLAGIRYKKAQTAEVLTVMTGMSYALLEHNKNFVDEKGRQTYYDIPSYIRLSNWVIKTGNGVNDYAIVPSPFSFVGKIPMLAAEGLDAAFTTAANSIAEEHDKATIEAMKQVPVGKLAPADLTALSTELLLGQVNINAMLPIGLGTSAEIGFNQDWKGQAIVPDFLQKLDKESQYIPGQTSKLAVEGGQLMGASPLQLQYAIEANTGALGRSIFDVSDMLISAVEGKEKPKIELGAVPFVNSFTGYGSEADKTNASQMYIKLSKQFRQANDTFATMKTRYEKGEIPKEEYLNYQQDNKELIRAYKTVIEPANNKINSLYTSLSKLQSGGYSGDRTPEKEVLGDPKLRDKIDSIRNQITDTREKALRQIRRDKDKYGDLWERRFQTSPQTDTVLSPFTSEKPVDKPVKKEYNVGPQSKLETYDDSNPPSLMEQSGMDLQTTDYAQGTPSVYEMFLPNGAKEFDPRDIKIAPGSEEHIDPNQFFKKNFPNIEKRIPKVNEVETRVRDKGDYYAKLAFAESTNNPNAKSKTSSARGLYQMTSGTWRGLVQSKEGKAAGLTMSGLFSKKQQEKGVRILTEKNATQLAKALKLPKEKLDHTALYAAHFLGASGAAKLLTTPYSKVAANVFPDEAKVNKPIFYDKERGNKPRTIKEVIQVLEKKMSNG